MITASVDKKYPLVSSAAIAILLTLLQASSTGAQLLSFAPEYRSNAFNDYPFQVEGNSPDQVQLLFDGTSALYADSLTPDAYALQAEREALPSRSNRPLTFGYLVDQAPQQLDAGKTSVEKLLDIVNQIKLSRRAEEEGDSMHDDDPISGPINDPREFEAGQDVNSAFGFKLPRAANRSGIFNNLLPLDLDSILNELKSQSSSIHPQVDDDTSFSTESDQKRETSTSASRYGGGEYIDHPLALVGHQYMQGGAGEGRQLLGPDGTFENVQVVKSDHAVPSYCNPPNPCPIGFTAEDGCLEQFVNSASFSREYQAKQQCSCDNEHSLFNCASPVSSSEGDSYSQQSNEIGMESPAPPETDNEDQNSSHKIPKPNDRLLNTLARTIQNRFGTLDSVRNLIMSHNDVNNNGD